MHDNDLVRIDLMKVKRKIFLSLPEDKKKDFLVASKLSELNYLKTLIPKDMADNMFYEYRQEIKNQLVIIALSLVSGILVSMSLLCFHISFPKTLLWNFWGIGLGVGLANAFKHCVYIYEDWQRMKPFKQDYTELQSKISKLWEDMIKDMK